MPLWGARLGIGGGAGPPLGRGQGPPLGRGSGGGDWPGADVVALLLSPQRLSLHDRAAKTVVVDVQPASQTSA